MYDFLIVGSGLFGSTFANMATSRGMKCLVIDKRTHIGGQCYTKDIEGINVHMYGAHIFKTNDCKIWEYVNKFAEFNRFTNTVLAKSGDKFFNLPFNMNTINEVFGVYDPSEAKRIIEKDTPKLGREPINLEEKAIQLVGNTLYKLFIKEYTEKQWGKSCSELPASILNGFPMRYTFNNNYYDSKYQGCPIGGYTQIFEKMLSKCDVVCDCDFFENRKLFKKISKTIIFTGKIDQYYDYRFGKLDYRSLEFEHKVLDKDNHQGVAVVNYCNNDVKFTRCIEHKHFCNDVSTKTIVTYEYPAKYDGNNEAYYPIEDDRNMFMYKKYRKFAEHDNKVYFGGRLGRYTYNDMAKSIADALKLAEIIL